MSWDIFMFKVPWYIRSVEDMHSNFEPKSLGKRDDVIKTIKKLFPDADFTDPQWGALYGKGYAIDFNMTEKADDEVYTLALHVYGSGEECVAVIRKTCKRMKVRAIDTGSGDFMDFKHAPLKGFREWKKYRDYVLGRSQQQPEVEKDHTET